MIPVVVVCPPGMFRDGLLALLAQQPDVQVTHEGRQTWDAHYQAIVSNILEAARRDPGRRILVALHCRHCHVVRRALHRSPEVHVVPYWAL